LCLSGFLALLECLIFILFSAIEASKKV